MKRQAQVDFLILQKLNQAKQLNCIDGTLVWSFISIFLSSGLVVSGILKKESSFGGTSDNDAAVVVVDVIVSLFLAPKKELEEPNLMGSLLELFIPNFIPEDTLNGWLFSGRISVGCVEREFFLANKLKGSDEDETKEDDNDVDGLSLWQQTHFSLSSSLLTKQVEHDHFLEAGFNANKLGLSVWQHAHFSQMKKIHFSWSFF